MPKKISVFKVELMIIDTDNIGGEEIKEMIENQKYPNYCISPRVMQVEKREIQGFGDKHPLNKLDCEEEFNKLFNKE